MKKLVHYIIIFLVIYWCFNNINGCSVGKDIKVPQIESEGHQCEGCTSPIEEVPQEELDSTNANTCYKHLKGAILNTEPHPNTFVELNHKIDVQSPRCIVVTIEYTIVNDINQKVHRECIGTHKYSGEGVMNMVDITDKTIL